MIPYDISIYIRTSTLCKFTASSCGGRHRLRTNKTTPMQLLYAVNFLKVHQDILANLPIGYQKSKSVDTNLENRSMGADSTSTIVELRYVLQCRLQYTSQLSTDRKRYNSLTKHSSQRAKTRHCCRLQTLKRLKVYSSSVLFKKIITWLLLI